MENSQANPTGTPSSGEACFAFRIWQRNVLHKRLNYSSQTHVRYEYVETDHTTQMLEYYKQDAKISM
jgi:hypothetical protein